MPCCAGQTFDQQITQVFENSAKSLPQMLLQNFVANRLLHRQQRDDVQPKLRFFRGVHASVGRQEVAKSSPVALRVDKHVFVLHPMNPHKGFTALDILP